MAASGVQLAALARRAQRRHPADADLAALRAELERAAGPTVGRAASARLLGLSQTALDRWIAAGDVPAVITPAGRREVPLAPLLDLLDAVEERRQQGSRRPLSRVLRERRRAAAPPTVGTGRGEGRGARGHRTAERRSLAYHAAIADRLDDAAVAEARTRLRRWRDERRIHPRYADAWQELLDGPRDRLRDALRSDDEHAAALRQSSPFAGMLDERERRALATATPDAG